MDRKGNRESRSHPGRKQKRSFRGNQYTASDITFTNASAAKLKQTGDNEMPISKEHGYCFINFFMTFFIISNYIICRECHGNVKFQTSLFCGLRFKIILKCKCGTKYIDSCPLINRVFEINCRLVFIMRLLGIGLEGLNLFCGMMDLGAGLSRTLYYACIENIFEAFKFVYEIILKNAIEEEKELNENEDSSYLTVSGDRTWKKRGFSSLFGVSILMVNIPRRSSIQWLNQVFVRLITFGKKLSTADFENWLEEHEDQCTKNHIGSAEKMKVHATVEMFLRSEETYNVKCNLHRRW